MAELDPDDASLHSKVNRLSELIERTALSDQTRGIRRSVERMLDERRLDLREAGPGGIHGSHIRKVLLRELGPGQFDKFISGRSLGQALIGAGLDIRTDRSGNFSLPPEAEATA